MRILFSNRYVNALSKTFLLLRILFSNRYANALSKTFLLFGFIHLIVLAFVAVRESIYVLNAFSILNLDLVIPGLGEGVVNLVISWCVVLAVYCFAYLYLTKPTN